MLHLTAADAAIAASGTWWQTILLGAVAGGIPGIIAFLLNRPAAKAKIHLEAEQVETNQFDVLARAQNAALLQGAEERKAQRAEIDALKADVADLKQDGVRARRYARVTNSKLESVHTLLEKIVARTGIKLTPGELRELEATRPAPFDSSTLDADG